jgi:hypothetical protein
VIRKEDEGYVLYSKDGSKKLGGPYKSRKEAEDREAQVQKFKHIDEWLKKNRRK